MSAIINWSHRNGKELRLTLSRPGVRTTCLLRWIGEVPTCLTLFLNRSMSFRACSWKSISPLSLKENTSPSRGYAVQSMRFLSAGNEAYVVEPALFLRDYLESLRSEEVKHFADIYLGGTTASGDARKILVPIFLPNSTYFHRNGRSSKGHGIWPCYTGSNRVEVQFTMAPSTDVVQVSAQVPGSIKDACKMMIHVVNMRR